MIKPVLAFVGVFVLTYLIGAFAVWDINPANWTEVGRFMVAVMGIGLGCLSALLVSEIQERL
jgi:hypothetical protein